MNADGPPDTYVTTHFRTVGYAGAGLFTLAPPAFLYEVYLTFYTTAVEDNPTIGLFMAVALILSFLSVPMMIVGRRKRYSARPSVDALPGMSGWTASNPPAAAEARRPVVRS